MSVITETEQALKRRLAASEEALQAKGAQLEAHLEEKARASKLWLLVCAACFLAGLIIAHLV